MTRRALLFIVLWLSAVPGVASAQQATSPWSLATLLDTPPELTLTGSVRLRYETIEGQERSGANAADQFINLRTILFAEYRKGAVRAGVQLSDSRVWSANAGSPVSTGEVNSFEPTQAYIAADIAHPFGSRSSATIQAGRLLLDLGSRRLIANDDYRNTTNGFTGLRADVTGGHLKATLIYVLPQLRLPDDKPSLLANRNALDRESFDAVLWGGIVTRAQGPRSSAIEFGFYHFGERDAVGRPTRDRSINSLDLRFYRPAAPGNWDYETEAILQTGQISSNLTAGAPVLGVRAWFAHARIGYSFATGWKPHVSVDFDAVSGDHGGTHYGRFDPLFGMRRGDFAPAGLYNAIGRSNLVSPGLRVEASPGKRIDLFGSYRAMWLESATDGFATTGVRDPLGKSGTFAGHQFDARLRYWIVPQALRFEADGVVFIKGNFLRSAPNAPRDGNTLYGSFNLTALF